MQSISFGLIAAMFAIIILGCVIAVVSRKGKPLSPVFISFALMAVLVGAFLTAFFLTQASFLQYVFAVLVIAIPFAVFVLIEKGQSKTTKANEEFQFPEPVPNDKFNFPPSQPYASPLSYAERIDFEPIVEEVPYTQPVEDLPFDSPIEELPIEDNLIPELEQPIVIEKPVWRKLPRNQVSHDSMGSFASLSNLPHEATGYSNNPQADSTDSSAIDSSETPSGTIFAYPATTKSTSNGFDSFGTEDMGIEEVSEYIVRDTETRRQNTLLDDGFEIEEPEFVAVSNKNDREDTSHDAQPVEPEQAHSQIVIDSAPSNELNNQAYASAFEEQLPPQEQFVQECVIEPKSENLADVPKEPMELFESSLLMEDSQGPITDDTFIGELNPQDNTSPETSPVLDETEEQFSTSELPNLLVTDAPNTTSESFDSSLSDLPNNEDIFDNTSSSPDSPESQELSIDTSNLSNNEEETPYSLEEQAKPKEIDIEDLIRKADSFRDKGMPDLAARFYKEAAAHTNKTSLARSLRFTELNCYVKAGNTAMINELANELRASSVLTKAERMKLQAVERFRK